RRMSRHARCARPNGVRSTSRCRSGGCGGAERVSASRGTIRPAVMQVDDPMISTHVQTIALPLAEDPVEKWLPYPLFAGQTPAHDHMACHVSVLSPGHCPHPPHEHVEEELLIILDGEAEILIADGPQPDGARVERLRAGSFVYYPAHQYHTIRN